MSKKKNAKKPAGLAAARGSASRDPLFIEKVTADVAKTLLEAGFYVVFVKPHPSHRQPQIKIVFHKGKKKTPNAEFRNAVSGAPGLDGGVQ